MYSFLFSFISVCVSVVSAKPQSPKLPNRHSRLNSFVEVTADGLTSETKKTGKRSGHLELQWNEDLTLWEHHYPHKDKNADFYTLLYSIVCNLVQILV